MSLWDIDDYATEYTIKKFYDALMENRLSWRQGAEYALQEAVLNAKLHYPRQPDKWGALLLYGWPTPPQKGSP